MRTILKRLLKLGILLVMIAAVAGGILWYRHHTPEQYEKRGDTHFRAKRYAAAHSAYLGAFRKVEEDRRKAALLTKIADTLLAYRENDFELVAANAGRAIKLLNKAFSLHPTQPGLSKRLLEQYAEYARELDTPAAWQTLYARANGVLTQAPGDQPARRYPRWARATGRASPDGDGYRRCC